MVWSTRKGLGMVDPISAILTSSSLIFSAFSFNEHSGIRLNTGMGNS